MPVSLDELVAGLKTTSLSDTVAYRLVCQEAATNPEVFKSFRRHPAYTRILEHVTRTQGEAYLNKLDPWMVLHPEWFKKNDEHGDPMRFEYGDGVGLVSPTTLRYVKVATDLRNMFGSAIERAHVIEVGGGYGGQARILRALFPVSYTILDLPEALMLAETYLKKFGIDKHVMLIDGERFAKPDTTIGLPGDLFLSNYALTECSPEVMAVYIKRVALNCPRGYITGNAQEKALFEQLAPVKPRRLDEDPKTSPDNFICVWP